MYEIKINIKSMLNNLQPQIYHRKARLQFQDVKRNLKLLQHIAQQLDSLSSNMSKTFHQVSLDKSEKLKIDIRQKLRSMGVNIDQMISVLDYKITIIMKQMAKIQKINGNCSENSLQKKYSIKSEEQYKYQTNQLQERIFQLQKKQNEYVKQISQLKQRNVKLRQDFANLSFDSNQRIKQLSQKLHNNTSPNLPIRRVTNNPNPQTSYIVSSEQNDKKKSKNNFVKIKGANSFQHELNHLEQSPPDYKKNKNMLDSFTSQSSQYDIKGLGYQIPEQTGNLRFGCFPNKQISQKTKTGSTSQNKRIKFQDKCDKSRRFQFLLNNLMDNKASQEIPQNYEALNNQGYQYKALSKGFQFEFDEYKSVFDEKAIKKYQI